MTALRARRDLLSAAAMLVAIVASSRAQVAEAPTDAGAAQRAVAAKYDFRAAPDRADGTYRPGEAVAFTCTLLDKASGRPAEAEIAWAVTKDGVKLGRGATTRPAADGSFRVDAGTIDEPGFLRFEATFVATDAPRKLSALAAAAFDRDRIAPGDTEPADLDAFWQAERAALAAVPMNVRLTAVASANPHVEAFDVRADIGDGQVLSAYLVRPVGAARKSLPAIVLPHAAGVFPSRLSVATTYAVPGGITEAGAIVLDFNAHGLPNDKTPAFYAKLRAGDLRDYRTRGASSRETIYFRTIFARLFRAIDVLTQQPEWDGRRVIASGRSQGGGQSLAAGALDPRVTCVVAEIPALCDHGGALADRATGWPHFLVAGVTPDPKVAAAIGYYDAAHLASRIKCPAYVTAGWTDTVCPPTSVYAMYNRLGGPKKLLELPALGHVISPEANAFVKASVREYLAK